MPCKKQLLGQITNNLDSKRIPLNSQQRMGMQDNAIYPYIGANNIMGYVNQYIFDEKILCIAEDGGSWGRNENCATIFNEKCWVNNHAHVLTAKSGVHLEYLCYYLNYTDLSSFITGTTRGKLTKSALNNIPIPLPPLPTQRAIAERLDRADALRQKDRQLLREYDALAQAVFVEMFGEEQNYSEYPQVPLNDIADIVSGVAKNQTLISQNFIEVPYMRVANVQDGKIDLNEVKTIMVSPKDYDKYQLQKGDILLTEGGDADKLGRGAVWKGEIVPCIHQNHIFRVRITNELITSIYLSWHISSPYGKRYFLKAAKQTTGIASINLTQLKNFKVFIPPLSLQTRFAAMLANIERQKDLVRRQQAESEALFGRLLQESFG